MQTVKLIFSRAHGVFSPAVRFATWSQWSHCGIVTPCGTVIESAFKLGGVVESPIAEFMERCAAWEIVEIPVHDSDAIIQAARSQLGKPYDATGLVGFVSRNRNWQDDDSWFCSELIAWAFDQGGTPLFAPNTSWRITPQHLYMVYHRTVYLNPNLNPE